MPIYLIYKHTSPTGKSYIGQTNNYGRRTSQHLLTSSKCTALKHAIQKYGFDNFQSEILAENLTLDEANELESKFILEHNTLAPNGYNLTTGGLNNQKSEETKLKMSQARKGKSNGPRTEDVKLKISTSKIGKPQSAETIAKRALSNTGKIRTPEQKERMSASQKGKPRSEETKQKIREAMLKRHQQAV